MKRLWFLSLGLAVALTGAGCAQKAENIADRAADRATDAAQEAAEKVADEAKDAAKDVADDAAEAVKDKVAKEVRDVAEDVADAIETKTIAMTAKQFEFSPSAITVKKGTPVKLLITSQDVTHGFSLPEFNVSASLAPGKTTTVEFTPDKIGTFPFSCNIICGSGHTTMTGKLIVE
ncbi:MAG: cupredoxin domain-containing protein [Patescibacteria group bacterium]